MDSSSRPPAPKRLPREGGVDVAAALVGLRRIVRALRVSSRSAEKSHGVSAAQLFVLQKLGEQPAASLRELAARTMTDPSSVSVVVNRLVQRGLVEREASAHDRRRTELRLTGEGRALLTHAPEPVQERLVAALKALPPHDREAVARSLGRIADALGPAAAPAEMFFEDELAPVGARSSRLSSARGPSARAPGRSPSRVRSSTFEPLPHPPPDPAPPRVRRARRPGG